MIRIFKKIQILLLCLGFFALNAQNLSAQEIQIAKISEKEEIDKTLGSALDEAKTTIVDIDKSINEAKKVVKKSQSEPLKELAKNKASIEEFRKNIAQLKIKLTSELKKKSDDLQSIANDLGGIELLVASDQDLNSGVLSGLYEKSLSNWRSLADSSLSSFRRSQYMDIEIPDLPTFPQLESFSELGDSSLSAEYDKSYQDLQKEYDDILVIKRTFIQLVRNYQSKLLLRSGKLRSQILTQLSNDDYTRMGNGYYEDLIRELKLIPYRPLAIFYSKIVDYNQALDSGVLGILSIIKQAFLLLIFVAVLFFGKILLKRATSLLNSLRNYFVKLSINDHTYSRFTILLSKFIPYFPWVTLIIIAWVAQMIISDTILEELGVVLPYFQYYFLYRILKIFLSSTLNELLYSSPIQFGERSEFNKKIKDSSQYLGLYLLISISLLHLTESVVRKALVYSLILDAFIWGLIPLLLFVTARWSSQIKLSVNRVFSGNSSNNINKLLDNDRKSFLFSLPIVLVIFSKFLLRRSIDSLQSNDFVKSLSAIVYKRKLESAAKNVVEEKKGTISNSYLKYFTKKDDIDDFIKVQSHPYDEVESIISLWHQDLSKENSMVIFGENGIGLSTFLGWIAEGFKEKTTIVNISIDKKIIDPKSLEDLLKKSFGFAKNVDLVKSISEYEEDAIIILDGCHNLFLSKKQGFEALKLFFDILINIRNPNLFWICGFNDYSWNYLQNALKVERYFRYQFKLGRWDDDDIKRLVTKKHNKSGFKLIYDPLIFAIGSRNMAREFHDVQNKFFQMLWGESKGNPRTAMYLWISSLDLINNSTIKVALPKTVKLSSLVDLSDNQFFVYSAIAKHHGLSVEEIMDVTSISKATIVNIVRIGIEKGYLREREGNESGLFLSDNWQIIISKLLRDKNFIYG